MSDQVITELENEDSILSFTHSKRKFIIESLLSEGIPKETEDTKLLLSALKDMDMQALGRKRIKVDEKINDSNEKAASIISKLLTEISDIGTPVGMYHNEIPKLPDSIPEPVLVLGEIEIDAEQQTYEKFMAKFDNQEED
jgi:hypothetical protein